MTDNAHVGAAHARNNALDSTAHIAGAHARNNQQPPPDRSSVKAGSLGYANFIKTQITDPSVPRPSNEPTRKYSKPKVPGRND